VYLQVVTQFLQLSAKEGLLLNVGTVMDLLWLEKGRRGINEEEDS